MGVPAPAADALDRCRAGPLGAGPDRLPCDSQPAPGTGCDRRRVIPTEGRAPHDVERADGRPAPVVRRGSASRYCAFGLGDGPLRDVALGSLSPVLVLFVEDDDPRWESLAVLAETIASASLRCLLADPRRCPTTALLLHHRGRRPELLLVVHGRTVRRLDLTTTAPTVTHAVALHDHVRGGRERPKSGSAPSKVS